jgi:hypothetical protein
MRYQRTGISSKPRISQGWESSQWFPLAIPSVEEPRGVRVLPLHQRITVEVDSFAGPFGEIAVISLRIQEPTAKVDQQTCWLPSRANLVGANAISSFGTLNDDLLTSRPSPNKIYLFASSPEPHAETEALAGLGAFSWVLQLRLVLFVSACHSFWTSLWAEVMAARLDCNNKTFGFSDLGLWTPTKSLLHWTLTAHSFLSRES